VPVLLVCVEYRSHHRLPELVGLVRLEVHLAEPHLALAAEAHQDAFHAHLQHEIFFFPHWQEPLCQMEEPLCQAEGLHVSPLERRYLGELSFQRLVELHWMALVAF